MGEEPPVVRLPPGIGRLGWFVGPIGCAAAVAAAPWAVAGGSGPGLAFFAILSALTLSWLAALRLTRDGRLPDSFTSVAAGATVALLSHLGMGVLWALGDLAAADGRS